MGCVVFVLRSCYALNHMFDSMVRIYMVDLEAVLDIVLLYTLKVAISDTRNATSQSLKLPKPPNNPNDQSTVKLSIKQRATESVKGS